MIRFLFRFIGLWLLAGAFVALVIDGTRSIAASRVILTPVIETWAAFSPAGVERFHEMVEQNLTPWVWDLIAPYVLYAPVWAVLGVLGMLFLLLGRTRAKPIGYSSRD